MWRVVIDKCVISCLIKTVQRCSPCGVLLLKKVYYLATVGSRPSGGTSNSEAKER